MNETRSEKYVEKDFPGESLDYRLSNEGSGVVNIKERVFISYTGLDYYKASILNNILDFSGIDNWFAPKKIGFGSEYRKKMREGIDSSNKMLVVWSKHSAKSEHVDYEWRAMISKGGVVAPIPLDDTPMPSELEARRSSIIAPEIAPILSGARSIAVSKDEVNVICDEVINNLKLEGVHLSDDQIERIFAFLGDPRGVVWSEKVKKNTVGFVYHYFPKREIIYPFTLGITLASLSMISYGWYHYEYLDVISQPATNQFEIGLGMSGRQVCEANGLVCVSTSQKRAVSIATQKRVGYLTPSCDSAVLKSDSCEGYGYQLSDVSIVNYVEGKAVNQPQYKKYCLMEPVYKYANCTKSLHSEDQ